MITRPFKTEFFPSENKNETTVRCFWGNSGGDMSLEIEHTIEELFSSVGLLGNNGGLSGEKFNPMGSSLTVERRRVADRYAFSWTLRHSCIDPGIIIVIQNFMHTLSLMGANVDVLSFATSLIDGRSYGADELPKAFRPIPYDFFHEVIDSTVVVDVEFSERQKAEHLQDARRIFDAWYMIAAYGGFADDFYLPNGRIALYIENELQITSVGMQIVYSDVATSEDAFYSLNNLLTCFHYKVAKLDSVSIS